MAKTASVIVEKFKQKLSKILYDLKRWFHSRERYQKNFDSNLFFMTILYFILITLLTLLIYNKIDFFNQYNLLFLRIGSSLLLLGLFFMVKYAFRIFRQVKHKHYNLSNGQKAIIAIILIVFVFIAYNNSDDTTRIIKNTTDKIHLSYFIPFSISEVVGNSNVISPDASSSKFDLRKFTNFLPQPWGFLIFWAILVGIIIFLLSKFVFGGELPEWFVWVLIIIAVIMAFQYKIPYNTVEIKSNARCDVSDNVRLESNFLGLGSMGLALSCA